LRKEFSNGTGKRFAKGNENYKQVNPFRPFYMSFG